MANIRDLYGQYQELQGPLGQPADPYEQDFEEKPELDMAAVQAAQAPTQITPPANQEPILDEEMMVQNEAVGLPTETTVSPELPPEEPVMPAAPQDIPTPQLPPAPEAALPPDLDIMTPELAGVSPEQAAVDQQALGGAAPEPTLQEMFAQYQAEKANTMMGANLAQAGAQIGQAFAGGASGNFKVDTSLYDAIRKQAGGKTDDFLKMQKAAGGSTGRRYQQMIVEDETGKNVIKLLDTATGEITDTEFDKGYALQSLKDIYGRQHLLSKGSGKLQRLITPDLKGKKTLYLAIKEGNPDSAKEIDERRKEFQSNQKVARAGVAKLRGLTEAQIDEATENPMAWAQLGAQVASIFENGRLTDEDVIRYTRNKQIIDRVVQFGNDLMNGTLTETNAVYLKQTLHTFRKVMKGALRHHALSKAKTWSTRYGYAPYQIAPMIYGEFRLSESERDAIDWLEKNPRHKQADKVLEKLQRDGLLPYEVD